jgi:hypothetical protein
VPDLVGLAQLGGFAFAAGVNLAILWTLFAAWRKGELVSRSIHDATVSRLVEENQALRRDHIDATRELARLARALEDLAARRR